MLIIRKGKTNNLIATVSMNKTLPNPYYLFSFQHIASKERVSFIPEVIVNNTRYDKFRFTEGATNLSLIPPNVSFNYIGQYYYSIYEQVSSSNTDIALAYNKLESGRAVVIVGDSQTDECLFEPYISDNEDAYSIIYVSEQEEYCISGGTPTPTPTPTETPTPTPTPVTPTPTPTNTPTPSVTPTQGAPSVFNAEILEVGSNVVMSGTGTFNINDLTLTFNYGGTQSFITPNVGRLTIGAVASNITQYSGNTLSGPLNFGGGGSSNADSGTGGMFGVAPLAGVRTILVPTGYVSGTNISGTATYLNESFSSLGLTPGTYTWTWGTGNNQGEFNLQIGPLPPTPTPTSTPTETPTNTPTPTITPTNNPICPEQIIISNQIDGSVNYNGTYIRLREASGSSMTYGYKSGNIGPGSVGTAPDGFNYPVYKEISSNKFISRIISNNIDRGWELSTTNVNPWQFPVTSASSSQGLGSTITEGSIRYPQGGYWGNMAGSYYISYPSNCPTPTPTVTSTSVTPTPTPTITSTPVTPTPTPTQTGPTVFNATISQSGLNVIMSGSGSFNTTDLGLAFNIDKPGISITPNVAQFTIGTISSDISQYTGTTITGPSTLGNGAQITTTLGGRGMFGIAPFLSGISLLVPKNYVSGTNIVGTSAYRNQTLSSMGLTPGTYTWTWGTGNNQGVFNLVIA